MSYRIQCREQHALLKAAFCVVTALTLLQGIRASAQVPEAVVWAYPHAPGGQAIEDDGTIYTVPGSAASYTWTQVRGRIADDSGDVIGFSVPDWHPGDHPPMPPSVADGRGTEVRPCGYCHMPHGLGRPENAAVAGLPVDYFIQQVNDMRSGARRTLDPRRIPPTLMLAAANAVADDAVREAAEYFASLTFTPWTRVVEADTVPKTHVLGGMLVPTEDGETEPLGERIIEVPEDWERTELRDTRSGFVAYVPMGSLARGEALVTTGAGKTVQCEVCHGPGLTGLGNIPPIAGRSPSYMFRQLYEMQLGIRNGAQAALMKPVVANLSVTDMIDVVAYVAALPPTSSGD